MSDLIDRQAATDAAIKAVDEWDGMFPQDLYGRIINGISVLPSAEPVIRCKDCKYYRADGDCWHEWDNDGRIYYQAIIDEPNPDDYCSRAERKEE